MALKQAPQREEFDRRILGAFRCIEPLRPDRHFEAVRKYYDGSFYWSIAGFSLYFNGFNLRGESGITPYGLFYDDGKAVFPCAYFKKPGEEGGKGRLMVGAPKGENALAAMTGFVREIAAQCLDIIDGTYVRFLKEPEAADLIKAGFTMVDEKNFAWDVKFCKEDETYPDWLVDVPALAAALENRKGGAGWAKEARHHYNGFGNFCRRNGLAYLLEPMNGGNLEVAREIVKGHFEILRKSGKAVGSTWEDYKGILTEPIICLPDVTARVGYLVRTEGKRVPVSAFVAESTGSGTAGCYVTISCKKSSLESAMREIGLEPEEEIANLPELIRRKEPAKVRRGTGSTHIVRGAMTEFLRHLGRNGVVHAHQGGSETKDHDSGKKILSDNPQSTEWVYLPAQ